MAVRAFEIVSATCAGVAAVFWFLSAWGKIPVIQTYWDRTPENDPFFVALEASALMNKWAAGFSGALRCRWP
jgi:hypothetical protein